MAKDKDKDKGPPKNNFYAKLLKCPSLRHQVVKDKSKYTRKNKHKNKEDKDEG